MIIVDQYETEPSLIYSGSTTDGVNVQSTLGDNQPTLGARFASRVEGVSTAAGTVNILYNQRLGLASGSFAGSKAKLRFVETQAENEFYFDSFVPSPASIANINGKFSPFLSFSLDGQSVESGLTPASEFNRPGQSERSAHVFFPGERRGLQYGTYPGPADPLKVDQFIDFDWITSPYPFQTKYRQLLRTLRPDSRYPESIQVTQDPTGSFITNPFSTSDIGSLFICLSAGAGTVNEVGRWTQIWSMTGSTTVDADANFEHGFVKCFNSLNDILWSNIPGSAGTQPDRYVAVGFNGTIITSTDGLRWDVVSTSRTLGSATDNPLVVAGYPGGDASDAGIYGIVDTGVLNSFQRYIMVGDFGIIRSTGTGLKEPFRTGWTYFDLPTALGAVSVRLRAITSNDDDGSASSGNARVCAVGDQIAPTQGTIVSSDQFGTTWTAATGIATSADPWYDVVYVGGASNKFIAVGENGVGSPPPGIVGRSPSSNGTGVWVDITPGGADRLLSVDWNPDDDTVIAVGDDGAIWRTTNAEASPPAWSLISPAGSYNGRWNSIRYVHDPGGFTGTWVVTGEDGETQVSTNNGISWSVMGLELPAKDLTVFSLPKIGDTSPVQVWMGRENYATLARAPRYMTVAGALTDELDTQGNFTLYFLRIGDANFRNFTRGINDAITNKKNEFVSGAQLPKPNVSDVFKTFFGFNKGLTLDLTDTNQGEVLKVGRTIGAVDFQEYSIYDLYRRDGNFGFGQLRLHGPIIKGWRYGIYNGVPTRSKIIYRNGRYGQFRDMLEPRKYTKFLFTRGDSTTTDPAVSINFVSGTAAAASASLYAGATSAVAFNPFDSGIFDNEYRSGQPFSESR